MGTNDLSIQICNSIEEAPNYNTNGQGVKGAMLTGAVVVRKGTVDLKFTDQDGKEYVAMVTGAILSNLARVVNAA